MFAKKISKISIVTIGFLLAVSYSWARSVYTWVDHVSVPMQIILHNNTQKTLTSNSTVIYPGTSSTIYNNKDFKLYVYDQEEPSYGNVIYFKSNVPLSKQGKVTDYFKLDFGLMTLKGTNKYTFETLLQTFYNNRFVGDFIGARAQGTFSKKQFKNASAEIHVYVHEPVEQSKIELQINQP